MDIVFLGFSTYFLEPIIMAHGSTDIFKPIKYFCVQPVGRVKIQVYRGPSKGDYDFAPWGYYNTQPADLAIHH